MYHNIQNSNGVFSEYHGILSDLVDDRFRQYYPFLSYYSFQLMDILQKIGPVTIAPRISDIFYGIKVKGINTQAISCE